jgi:Protein of unknown function (DUF1302)
MSMRSRRRALTGLAMIGAIAVSAGEGQATQKYGPLELSGNLQAQQLIRHPDVDQYQLIQQRNTVRLRVDWAWLKRGGKFLDRFEIPWVESSSLLLLYRGVYDSVYDYQPSVRTTREFTGERADPRFDNLNDLGRRESDGAKFESVLREAYVDIKFKNDLSLRLGRQQIIWGESDGFRLLDRANSLDLTWHFQQELPPPAFGFDDIRRPFWMAKGLYNFGNVGSWSNVFVEAYWNPGDWEPNKLRFLPYPWGVRLGDPLHNPRNGAFFFPERAVRLMNGTKLFKQGNYSRNPIENSQLGIRFNGVTGEDTPLLPAGIQLQVGYLYQRFTASGGVSTSAAVARGLAPDVAGQIETARLRSEGTLPVEFYAPYIHTIGIAANYFDETTSVVWRTESAYDFGLPFYSCGHSPNRIAQQERCVRETTFAPFLPGIRNHDVWSGLFAFDRPTWIRPLNKKTTFFLTGQFFWNYMIEKSKSTIGGLDLPTVTRPLNQDPAIAYRDDIHRWEMLFTFAILGFYRGGSVVPSMVYLLDPVNSYSQEVVWGVDYFITPNFAVNLAQRYLINPTKEVNFEPWGLGGLNAGRSETGLRFTYQF